MVSADPKKRCDPASLMTHPWFKQVDKRDVIYCTQPYNCESNLLRSVFPILIHRSVQTLSSPITSA